jgi:hypothetical protein
MERGGCERGAGPHLVRVCVLPDLLLRPHALAVHSAAQRVRGLGEVAPGLSDHLHAVRRREVHIQRRVDSHGGARHRAVGEAASKVQQAQRWQPQALRGVEDATSLRDGHGVGLGALRAAADVEAEPHHPQLQLHGALQQRIHLVRHSAELVAQLAPRVRVRGVDAQHQRRGGV